MKVTTLLLLMITFASCSKAPMFNTEDNSSYRSSQPLEAKQKLGNLNIGLQWVKGPRVITANGDDSENIFKLRMWSNESTVYGPYSLPEKVCVFLWMKMPDGSEHGSAPVAQEVEDNDDGDILVIKKAYFVMNGVWQIRVRTVAADTTCRATKNFDYIDETIFEANIF